MFLSWSLHYPPTHSPPIYPPVLPEFSLKALSASSINTTHQAPAALSLLEVTLLPGLRRAPALLFQHLDDIITLCLPGLDGNYKKKTVQTLGILCYFGKSLPRQRENATLPGTNKRHHICVLLHSK